jgi:hydrogenase/urease accessory protein HupE
MRRLLASSSLLLLPVAVSAHPGHDHAEPTAGLVHLVSGYDPALILAAIAVAVGAGLLSA